MFATYGGLVITVYRLSCITISIPFLLLTIVFLSSADHTLSLQRRVLTLAAVAGCAIGQNTFITTLPCFDKTGYPTPCTFALSAAESNKGAGFALGGGGFGGGFGTQFGEGTFGGVVVTTTTPTLPVEDAADPAEGEASGAGETIVEPGKFYFWVANQKSYVWWLFVLHRTVVSAITLRTGGRTTR